MKKIEELLGKIQNQDCLEFLKEVPDNSVDLVITSPPYNKNGLRGYSIVNTKNKTKWKRWSGSDINYGEYKDDKSEVEYQEWQIALLNEFHRVIKDTGSILYNHKVRRAQNKASHPLEWILKAKPNFYQQIIWNRLSACDHNVNYLDPITESLFWLVKGKPICNKIKPFMTEIINIPPENNTKHPAPFPRKLVSFGIILTTNKDGIVLDPFMGSGTTAVASEMEGRKWLGCELSKEYCKMATERIEQGRLQYNLPFDEKSSGYFENLSV